MSNAVHVLGVQVVVDPPEVIMFLRPTGHDGERGTGAPSSVLEQVTVAVKMVVPVATLSVSPAESDPSTDWVRHYI